MFQILLTYTIFKKYRLYEEYLFINTLNNIIVN